MWLIIAIYRFNSYLVDFKINFLKVTYDGLGIEFGRKKMRKAWGRLKKYSRNERFSIDIWKFLDEN